MAHGHRASRFEGNQGEDGLETLARFEFVQARDQFSRAGPAQVVDPVVAVRGDAKLRDPSKGRGGRSVDADCTDQAPVVIGQEPVTLEWTLELRRLCAPVIETHSSDTCHVNNLRGGRVMGM